MPHRRRTSVVALVAVFLLLLALSWVCGHRVEPAPHRLRFEAGDGSVRPLFVSITRGRRDTNYVSTPPGIKLARVVYLHRFYYASQQTVQPVTALRYRASMWAEPALRWLGVQDKFLGPMADQYTSTDTSVLWFGYRATNSVFSEDAVLVSDQGLRLPLKPEVEDTRAARAEHLMSWELPWLLTNRGEYRLTLTRLNQTILTFVYD
ncbi:MAG: hypothetical protein ACLQU3_24270 [Limisphaerales bacterium]